MAIALLEGFRSLILETTLATMKGKAKMVGWLCLKSCWEGRISQLFETERATVVTRNPLRSRSGLLLIFSRSLDVNSGERLVEKLHQEYEAVQTSWRRWGTESKYGCRVVEEPENFLLLQRAKTYWI